jgi:hypothetical protein
VGEESGEPYHVEDEDEAEETPVDAEEGMSSMAKSTMVALLWKLYR